MDKEHLRTIRINKEIGNYEKEYCEICGREFDIYESMQSRENYFMAGKVCLECQDNY